MNRFATLMMAAAMSLPVFAKDKLVVGFAQIGAENEWRSAETTSVQEEAAKRGIELKFSDAQQKQENEIKAIRAFIAQHVDAILLAPVVETGWDPVLREAKRAHIPVILLDRGIKTSDDSLYTTMIGSDFVAEGRMAGEWLAKKMNGKANIAELQGTPGASAATDRQKGFADAIANYPDMKIVKSQTGDFNRQKGKETMEAFLKSEGKNINALYAHNDAMALGAVQAIQEAGEQPGKDVIVVSIDGIKEAFEGMKDGKLNCTVECSPLLGPAAFDAVNDALADKQLPKKTIVQDKMYTQDQAAEALPTRKY